jgi:hypothetical protein
VEVPQSGPSRSNEVEMSGMGRSNSNYGRLGDEDDEVSPPVHHIVLGAKLMAFMCRKNGHT